MRSPRRTLTAIAALNKMRDRTIPLVRFPGLMHEVPRVRKEIDKFLWMFESGFAIVTSDGIAEIKNLAEQIGLMEYDYLHGGLDHPGRKNP